VTETVPEPETAVFRQNRGEPKPRFLEPSEYGFASDVCVYIRYKANELVQARLKVHSKSSASAKFTYLIPEQLCICFESAS